VVHHSSSLRIRLYAGILAFPSRGGDCALAVDDTFGMLVDGGYKKAWSAFLLPTVSAIVPSVPLLVLSHMDEDHIDGVVGLGVMALEQKVKIATAW
jgi:hypothetical protein